MKTFLTTVPVSLHYLTEKILARHQKRQADADANTLNNIERLYHLKEQGILTEEEYQTLKDRLKTHIR